MLIIGMYSMRYILFKKVVYSIMVLTLIILCGVIQISTAHAQTTVTYVNSYGQPLGTATTIGGTTYFSNAQGYSTGTAQVIMPPTIVIPPPNFPPPPPLQAPIVPAVTPLMPILPMAPLLGAR
jgi:hypothetical protein